MKAVVADTSPINYLLLIGYVDLLRQLYTRIVIPEAVFKELTDAGAPPLVEAWMRTERDWIEIRSAPSGIFYLVDGEPALDAGEVAAIQLALAEHDSLLLIDDAASVAAIIRQIIV